MSALIFGEPWDAPICEGPITVVELDAGATCIGCDKPILSGENGQMLPSHDGQLLPEHKECLLLGVIGHEYNICSCTNYGGTGSRRAGAIRLWGLVSSGTNA